MGGALLLAAGADGRLSVPRRRLAEFFDLPEPYLAKLLKALVAAEVLASVPGVNGGYRLARPAAQITVLEVVRGVNGHTAMFHCAEIRQRGPVGLTPAQCRQPCGIAKVMYGADRLAQRPRRGDGSRPDRERADARRTGRPAGSAPRRAPD